MARVGSLLYVGGTVIEPTDGSIISTQGIEGPFLGGYQLDAVAGGRICIGGDDMIVMKGSKTPTGSAPETESPTENDTEPPESDTNDGSPSETTDTDSDEGTPPKMTPTDSDKGTSPGTTANPSNTDQPSTTHHDETTATDGPGFGLLGAITSIGIGGWRYGHT